VEAEGAARPARATRPRSCQLNRRLEIAAAAGSVAGRAPLGTVGGGGGAGSSYGPAGATFAPTPSDAVPASVVITPYAPSSSGPTGPQEPAGPNGATSATGATGATGPVGPAGEIELVRYRGSVRDALAWAGDLRDPTRPRDYSRYCDAAIGLAYPTIPATRSPHGIAGLLSIATSSDSAEKPVEDPA
jgi:hypothetical protein